MKLYGNYLRMICVNQENKALSKAEMPEKSPNLIKQIYDVIRQDTHDLDIENIYRVLLEKAVLSA